MLESDVEVRVVVVAVAVYVGTYPDEGALASHVKRCLEDRRHGLALGDVRVTEVTDAMLG